MTSERVFEIGTMAGLMTVFGRHSGFMTNFKILGPESRPMYGCGSPGVRRGQEGPGVPGGHGIARSGNGWALAIPWLGPGNTNVARLGTTPV